MSFVLDALRRAEAERQRGQVPGVLTPASAALPPGEPAAAPGRRRLGLLALAAAGMLALGLLIGALLAPRRTPAPPPAIAAVPAAAVAVAPPALHAPAPAPAPATATAPAPAPATAPAPAPVPVPAAAPAAAATRAPVSPPTAAAPPAAAATPSPVAPAVAAAHPAGPAAWAPAPPRRLQDLPPELRRALPALSFGGAMDSPQPASRMLIVNGLLLHEGDEAAPGLRLATIRLRSAVFEFRGQRFEIDF